MMLISLRGTQLALFDLDTSLNNDLCAHVKESMEETEKNLLERISG